MQSLTTFHFFCRYFKTATAPTDRIENDLRKQSIKWCALKAHHLTDPEHDSRHPRFIKGVQLCVDDAVAETRAEFSHVATAFRALNQLRNEDHSDVTLQAGDDDHRCHRLILMATSGFFRTLFAGDGEDAKAPMVVLKDCEPQLARRLVTFIYEGKVAFTSVEDATAVLEKAQYYQIDTLVATCTRYLTPRVGAYNSLELQASDITN